MLQLISSLCSFAILFTHQGHEKQIISNFTVCLGQNLPSHWAIVVWWALHLCRYTAPFCSFGSPPSICMVLVSLVGSFGLQYYVYADNSQIHHSGFLSLIFNGLFSSLPHSCLLFHVLFTAENPTDKSELFIILFSPSFSALFSCLQMRAIIPNCAACKACNY